VIPRELFSETRITSGSLAQMQNKDPTGIRTPHAWRESDATVNRPDGASWAALVTKQACQNGGRRCAENVSSRWSTASESNRPSFERGRRCSGDSVIAAIPSTEDKTTPPDSRQQGKSKGTSCAQPSDLPKDLPQERANSVDTAVACHRGVFSTA